MFFLWTFDLFEHKCATAQFAWTTLLQRVHLPPLTPKRARKHVNTSPLSAPLLVSVLLEDSLRAWTRLPGCSQPEKTSTDPGAALRASLGCCPIILLLLSFLSFWAKITADVPLSVSLHSRQSSCDIYDCKEMWVKYIHLMYPDGWVFSSGLNVCENSQSSWLKCSQMLFNKNRTYFWLQFFTIHLRHNAKRLAVLLGTCMTNINGDIEEDFIVWPGPRELQLHVNDALCTAVLVTVIFACLCGISVIITAATERSGWNHE